MTKKKFRRESVNMLYLPVVFLEEIYSGCCNGVILTRIPQLSITYYWVQQMLLTKAFFLDLKYKSRVYCHQSTTFFHVPPLPGAEQNCFLLSFSLGSLRSLRYDLQSHGLSGDPSGLGCWRSLLKVFQSSGAKHWQGDSTGTEDFWKSDVLPILTLPPLQEVNSFPCFALGSCLKKQPCWWRAHWGKVYTGSLQVKPSLLIWGIVAVFTSSDCEHACSWWWREARNSLEVGEQWRDASPVVSDLSPVGFKEDSVAC